MNASLKAASVILTFTATAVFAATFLLTPALHAQTPAAKASPTPPAHKKMKLRSRELPPSGGGPFASMPNYVATALTLRHWHQPEVKFHVTPADDDSRTPEQVRALVQQGLDLWKDKVSSKLTLDMCDDADSADVEIEFVPPGSLSGGRIGVTDIQFTVPEMDIQHAKIRINEGLSAAQLVQCVAHESGHALGIQGHSDGKGDLMFAYAHLPAAITDRDINTMNVGYYKIDTTQKVRDFKRGQKFASATSY